jgi:hypothetical protein
MSRISMRELAAAITKIRAMDMKQKEAFVDELVREQPHMFASFLVQQQMGVSFEKMEFLLEILLICYQAMRESGKRWPLITEDEQDRQMSRYVAAVKFGENLSPALSDRAMQQYIAAHPEQPLLAFVTSELAAWLGRITPEDTDNYVMLAATNLVNCIAFVPMPTATAKS